MKHLIVALALILGGCASHPIISNMPVPQKVEAPIELYQCGTTPPAFKFYDGLTPDEVVLLRRDWPNFQKWIEEKNRCLEAWKAWGRTK